MGKGNRNRQFHYQERLENPQKFEHKKAKKKASAPQWLKPLIGIVLAVAIVFLVAAEIVTNNGMIQRNRILIESQSGKFDVTQQMATYIAWQNLYSQGYWYWSYSSQLGDTTAKQYEQDEYALMMASTLQSQLRDGIDDVIESLKTYVAVCDAAYAESKDYAKLSEKDQETIDATLEELKNVKNGSSYATTTMKVFLDDIMAPGMKEKDIRAALELMTVYNNYYLRKQVGAESTVTADTLLTFRDENPGDYYTLGYLTFAADNKELADQLEACTTPAEFKETVLKFHFEDNYKVAYNKFTTQVEATDALKTLTGKTNTATGTAWTDAVKAIEGIGDSKGYTKGDETLAEEVSTWLFDSKRKAFESTVIATEDGIYLVALEKIDGDVRTAYVKMYEMKDGDSHGEDVSFKTTMLEYLLHEKAHTEEGHEHEDLEIPYKDANEKAADLKKELEAEGADIAALLAANKAVSIKNTSDEKQPAVPEAVEDMIDSTLKKGDILTAIGTDASYTIYVDDVVGKTVDFSYVTFTNDLFFDVVGDLSTSLNKVYPTEKTQNYKPNADKDTFEAWVSEHKEGTLEFNRLVNDTKYFETTKDEVTTYNVYMVTKKMGIDEDTVYHGGYLLNNGEGYGDKASENKTKLEGKTYAELVSALANIGGTTSQSAGIKESAIADANLKAWFASADRKANEIAIVDNVAKNGKYVAAFIEKMPAWQSAAKINYVNKQLTDWIDGLTKNYTVNEKALEKIGEPSTTAPTTSAATKAPSETVPTVEK